MADSVDQPPRLPSVEIAGEHPGSKNSTELDLANPAKIEKATELDMAKPAEIENSTEPDLAKPAEIENATELDLAKLDDSRNVTEPDLAKPSKIDNGTESDLAKHAEGNATKLDLKNSSTSFDDEMRLLIEKIQGSDPDETALKLNNLTWEQKLEIIKTLVTGIFWSVKCKPESYPKCFTDCVEDIRYVGVFSWDALKCPCHSGNIIDQFLDMDAKATANKASYCVLAPRLVSMLILFLLHDFLPRGDGISELIHKHRLMLKLPTAIKYHNQIRHTKTGYLPIGRQPYAPIYPKGGHIFDGSNVEDLGQPTLNIPTLVMSIVEANNQSAGYKSAFNIKLLQYPCKQTITRKEVEEKHGKFLSSLLILGTPEEMAEKEKKLRQILNTNMVQVISPAMRDGIRLFTRLFAHDLDSIVANPTNLDAEKFSWPEVVTVPMPDQASDRPLKDITGKLNELAMGSGRTSSDKLFLSLCIRRIKTCENFDHSLLGQVTPATGPLYVRRRTKKDDGAEEKRQEKALAVAIRIFKRMDNPALLADYKELLRNLRPFSEVAENE